MGISAQEMTSLLLMKSIGFLRIFIWVGLGTPKQQEWISRNIDSIDRGVLLAVGFAFDVNAGNQGGCPHVDAEKGYDVAVSTPV